MLAEPSSATWFEAVRAMLLAHVPPLDMTLDTPTACEVYTPRPNADNEIVRFARLWIQESDVRIETLAVGIDPHGPHALSEQMSQRRRGAHAFSLLNADASVLREIQALIDFRVRICESRRLI